MTTPKSSSSASASTWRSSDFGSTGGTGSSSLWQWGAGFDDDDDSSNPYGSSSSSSNEVTDTLAFAGGKDCIIFLVDASPAMFEDFTPADEDAEACSFFTQAIKAVHSALKDKILTSAKDLSGIVFYSTEKRKNDADPEHVYLMQELDVPSAEQIQALGALVEGDTDFGSEIGSSRGVNSLNDALWFCSNLFASVRSKVETKRILLFTNNDNPYADHPDLRKQTETKAKDLSDVNIDIDLMHMSAPDATFDIDLFFRDFVINTDDSPEKQVSRGFEQLVARTRSKSQKKRARMTIPFQIGDGFEIGVKVYNLVGDSSKSSYVWLDSADNGEVVTKTRYYCAETSAPLLATDMKYTYTYGGEKVVFDKEEVDKMRDFGPPGLLLLGFKPKATLLKSYNVKKSSFIYPDDSIIGGSTKFFSALLDRCLTMEKVAICRLIERIHAQPYFVALLPQREVVDADERQLVPPGFHIITLPFTDDMRTIKKPAIEESPTEEQVSMCKKLIKSMDFNEFTVEEFCNPVLQQHYAALEALALEKDEPEPFVDHTVVDEDAIPKKAHERSKKLHDLLYPSTYEPELIASAKKTTAKRGATSSGPSKRAKPSNTAAPALDELKTMNQSGVLKKLTVAQLKAAIEAQGKTAKGKRKADHLSQLEEILNSL